ncbi:MAG: response regulator transcription factor [Trueperaceae bacterium]|nr:response regulator transcription factor [Trueperaceae bacterium]
MARVLVVEDDRDIAESLELFLRHDGHHTKRAHDGRRALELEHATQPDLVLLDLGLPELDGLEVLKAIRARSDLPVIVVTARREEVDELIGLGLGADDYVTKPFAPRTLLARVKAVLRRGAHAAPVTEATTIGPLVVDRYRVEARVDDEPIALTPTEFALLAALADAPGKAMRREELIERAMPDSDALERTVDGHLKNLRRKLGDHGVEHLLETVRGSGYRLRAPRP